MSFSIDKTKFKIIINIISLLIIIFSLYRIVMPVIIDPNLKYVLYDDFHFFYYSFHTILHPSSVDLMYNLNHQLDTFREIYGTTKGELGYYMYPPQFAVFLFWFAFFPYSTAKIIWTVVNCILFFIGVILMIKISYKKKGKTIPLFLFAIALLFYPLYSDYFWGQSNRLIFFLLCLTFYFYQTERKILAGIPLTFAVSFKILPGIFILYFLYRREWKVFFSILTTAIITSSITILIVGWNTVWKYITHDISTVNRINELHGGAPWNSSFKGVLKTYFEGAPIDIIYIIYALIIVIFTLFVLKRNNKNKLFELSIITSLMLLLSPVVEVHYPTLLIIPIIVLAGFLLNGIIQYEIDTNTYHISITLSTFIHLIPLASSISLFTIEPFGTSYFCSMLILFIELLHVSFYTANKSATLESESNATA